MPPIDKRSLSERDICTKFITPAVRKAGWDEMTQIREEVGFTKGRIIVRGKLVTRGKDKRADYILYFKPNIPIALIEAKDNNHAVGDGMQQALEYAETLQIPFVFASNGDGFVFHDRTGVTAPKESNLVLDAFPSPAELWAKYRQWKGLKPKTERVVLQDYYDDGGGKSPRYYQVNAVNAAEIPDLLHYLDPLFSGITIQFYYPYHQRDELFLDFAHRSSLLDEIIRLKRSGVKILNSESALQALKNNSWTCRDWLIDNADPDGTLHHGCYLKGRTDIDCARCGFSPHTEISLAFGGSLPAIRAGLRIFF